MARFRPESEGSPDYPASLTPGEIVDLAGRAGPQGSTGVGWEAGSGVPTHVAPQGTLYLRTATADVYRNLLGTDYWEPVMNIAGAQGNQGFQGDTGATGNQGDQGNQGFQGDTGATGNQGDQGFQGFQGFQGDQGTQGAQGFQGDIGSQGAQGDQGNQGFQGDQGFQGEPG